MARKSRKPRRYPFLPGRFQGGAFMVWLKRLHGWIGMLGAIVGIIIGITGITLNHRAQVQAGQANVVENFQLKAPGVGLADWDTLDRYVAGALDLDVPAAPAGMGRPTGPGAAGAGAQRLRYQSARVRYDVTHVPGNEYMSVVKTTSGPISTMNSLHLGNRSGIVWVLILDAFAGSLIFLAVSGILLWSRMHGPPLLAISLVLSFLAGTFYVAAVL